MLRSGQDVSPFDRFWAAIEAQLVEGQSSNPVAFASAPVGSILDQRSGRNPTSPSRRKGKRL